MHHIQLYLPTYLPTHRVWMRLGLPKFRLKLEGRLSDKGNFLVCFLCVRQHCRTKESDCHDIVLQRFIEFCVFFFFYYKKKNYNKKPTMQLRHATYWSSSLKSIIPAFFQVFLIVIYEYKSPSYIYFFYLIDII